MPQDPFKLAVFEDEACGVELVDDDIAEDIADEEDVENADDVKDKTLHVPKVLWQSSSQ